MDLLNNIWTVTVIGGLVVVVVGGLILSVVLRYFFPKKLPSTTKSSTRGIVMTNVSDVQMKNVKVAGYDTGIDIQNGNNIHQDNVAID